CFRLKNRRVKTNQWSDAVMAEEEGIRFLMVDARHRCLLGGGKRHLLEGDVVGIKTWCQSEGRIGTRRDGFLRTLITVKSLAVLLGFLLIIVCFLHCKWVMMNQDTRRLQKVSDDVRDEYLMFCPKEPRLAFPEEENNKSLKKILKLEDPAKYSIIGLKPRRIDLDMNHHVNNVTYIGWLLEVSVIIRQECQQDDVVDSITTSKNGSATSGTQSHNDSQFLHLLRLSGDGQEINRGTTLRRKKPSR
ncbi:unnamed protein product, partial [Brassica oleracea]